MARTLPQKLASQIRKAGLPLTGPMPFTPKLARNKKGQQIIEKAVIEYGPKRGKRGYVDQQGRIWIRDPGHAGYPDHWDVQEEAGEDYVRVDLHGNILIAPTPSNRLEGTGEKNGDDETNA